MYAGVYYGQTGCAQIPLFVIAVIAQAIIATVAEPIESIPIQSTLSNHNQQSIIDSFDETVTIDQNLKDNF